MKKSVPILFQEKYLIHNDYYYGFMFLWKINNYINCFFS
ncbi:hypothetical protein ASZ90_008271 [hydrocarbon metagenome]|uniref:Uncharacterized protein n=1 Tax=hydrocarbon metagenome TaxID=938273 RepID=A0A0W8FMA1_9ZZZZ